VLDLFFYWVITIYSWSQMFIGLDLYILCSKSLLIEKIPLFGVLWSMHHSTVHKEKSNQMKQCIKILLFHIYMKLNMFRGDAPPIIRSLKLHWQPLVFHAWKVVGRVVGRRCQAHVRHSCAWQRPPTTHPNSLPRIEKPEAASAVLGFWWWAVRRPETCWASYK